MVKKSLPAVPALAAAAVLIAGTFFVLTKCIGLSIEALTADNYQRLFEIGVLYSIIALLLYAVLVFCIAEYGYVQQEMASAKLSAPESAALCDRERRDLLLLVPSFKENEEVIGQALFAAALVEYPRRRVVLLIDDPPAPATNADARILAAARRLPQDLQARFAVPSDRLGRALAAFAERAGRGAVDGAAETRRLARLYNAAADWLDQQAREFGAGRPGLRHSERLFIDRILLAPARHHRERAREIGAASLSAHAIEREYRRLASLYRVEFDSFERKRYVNLSHAPNKAMNLNSYIALVGKDWREVGRPEGVHLEACEDGAATLQVPAADYIVAVDADSLVTCDYATRLVGALERPDNARVAIAQTPYTAVPEPPVAIERAASASTDAQFFNHQGMAWLGAPFWVGASALMRHAALEDIATEREERGHRIRVYIDDTILIEDAAATIDLLDRGWQVHHDTGRLSYSATPADFGALVIQRRRWANGGLLILPRLLRHAFRRPWSSARLVDAALRIPNLISASIAGIGLPIVLLYRFDDSLLPLWIPPLLAGPYCLLYGRDLTRAGYRWSDLPRVFALNLLLIPVNFAGISQSLRQAFTGRAIPFQRTPKVAGRTRTPLAYLCALYGFCVFAAITAVVDLVTGRYEHILFPLIAGTATAYGIVTFVGLAHSRDDLLARLRAIRARRARALVPGRRSQEGAVR